MIWAALKLFWTNSIVYCDLLNGSLTKPAGGGWGGGAAEQGVRSLKIATRQRELERKRLVELLHHHSAGPLLLCAVESLLPLMFLSAVQSGGCRDMLPLGQHYKHSPKLAARLPAIGWCWCLTRFFFFDKFVVLRWGQKVHGDGLGYSNWHHRTAACTRHKWRDCESVHAPTHMQRYVWIHVGKKTRTHTYIVAMLKVWLIRLTSGGDAQRWQEWVLFLCWDTSDRNNYQSF